MATITEPSADQQKVDAYNRKAFAHQTVDLETGAKYALVLLKLASAVTPSDYAALGSAISGITGIQNAQLVIDNQNNAGDVTAGGSVPTGYKIVAHITEHMRMEASGA